MQIDSFQFDKGLQAQARYELEGLLTFTVPEVAFITLRAYEKVLYLKDFYVTESRRREGIGTRLFKRLEQDAIQAGFTIIGISLDTTHKMPKAALAFAKSVGLKINESGSDQNHIGLSKPLLRVVRESTASVSA